MPKHSNSNKHTPKDNKYPRYHRRTFRKSPFDNNSTLTLYQYQVPKPYIDPVHDVLTAFKSGIPFNRAVDQVSTLYPHIVNRNKLAEHTLKYIANDY